MFCLYEYYYRKCQTEWMAKHLKMAMPSQQNYFGGEKEERANERVRNNHHRIPSEAIWTKCDGFLLCENLYAKFACSSKLRE